MVAKRVGADGASRTAIIALRKVSAAAHTFGYRIVNRRDQTGELVCAFAGESEDMKCEPPRLSRADSRELLKLCNQAVEGIHAY